LSHSGRRGVWHRACVRRCRNMAGRRYGGSWRGIYSSVEGGRGIVSVLMEKVFTRIEDLPPAPTVATIGAFDGVHKGHQHILGLARERARTLGARLLVLTFEPLPIQVFRPETFAGRILTPQRRREYLMRYGADAVVELQFDREMAKVTASEFMHLLFDAGPLLEMWVGHDFALGHKREGTPDRLREISREHGTV